MIVAGILLLLARGGSFLWAAPKMDAVRSFGGQLAQAFGGQSVASEVRIYQAAYYGGIVAMVIGGILLIAGITMKNRKSA